MNLFVKTLGEVRDHYVFALVGYVVMPEHVHLLIGEPKTGTPATAMQVLKQRVSTQLRAGNQLPAEPVLPRFWQLRFHDFNVWSRKKQVEKLQYMHQNPVKRGLVANPCDWPWSSFSSYAKGRVGLLPIDRVQ
jgi:putative transposase